ncbi:MAG: DUF6263 family protein, partial [Planctomycetota bacterium]
LSKGRYPDFEESFKKTFNNDFMMKLSSALFSFFPEKKVKRKKGWDETSWFVDPPFAKVKTEINNKYASRKRDVISVDLKGKMERREFDLKDPEDKSPDMKKMVISAGNIQGNLVFDKKKGRLLKKVLTFRYTETMKIKDINSDILHEDSWLFELVEHIPGKGKK